jgi:hypothetical protein
MSNHKFSWIGCDCNKDTCQMQVCVDCDDVLARGCE